MLNDYYEYRISETFASALINQDISGLDDNEERQLDAFLDSTPQGLIAGTFVIEDGEPSFERCDICELHANCVTLRLYFHNETLGESS
jgi:hypothetical protein